jgi:uncharacterized membrane protein
MKKENAAETAATYTPLLTILIYGLMNFVMALYLVFSILTGIFAQFTTIVSLATVPWGLLVPGFLGLLLSRHITGLLVKETNVTVEYYRGLEPR